MNAQEIAREIVNGNFNVGDINIIIRAIKEAQRMNRARASASALFTLKVGMRGRLTGLTPKTLNGTEVEVLELKRTRVVVHEVDKPSYMRYTVPAECIIPIS